MSASEVLGRKPRRSGRIVATASTAGLAPEALVCYGYAAAKGAVVNRRAS